MSESSLLRIRDPTVRAWVDQASRERLISFIELVLRRNPDVVRAASEMIRIVDDARTTAGSRTAPIPLDDDDEERSRKRQRTVVAYDVCRKCNKKYDTSMNLHGVCRRHSGKCAITV